MGDSLGRIPLESMDSRLEKILRGLIAAERSRRQLPVASAVAKAIERIPPGHGYYFVAVDLEAAREYDLRAKQWIELAKRVLDEAGFAWTTARAAEVESFLASELIADSNELVGLIRSRTQGRGNARMTELDSATQRVRAEIPHQLDLLVLAQDRNRVPVAEQLLAPRYAAVRAAWSKALDLLDAPQPDYSNAAKDAVGAVEQLARLVVGEPAATLGDAIKALRGSGRVEPPLLKGIEEIWGWASDTPSVRHGASAVQLDSVKARYIVDQATAAIALLLSLDAA